MRISGIYKIVNIKNDKFYIGSAVDINRRWKCHRRCLKNGNHENIHLQRAYNKYGEESFVYEIVEKTPDILLREQHYLDMLKPWDFTIGYNIGKQSSGGDNLTNHPNRKDIVKRITQTIRSQVKNMSDKEKSGRWNRGSGKLNPNWKGGISTPACKGCGKKLLWGHKRCSVCSKQGHHNPFYGKHHSIKTKEIVSRKMKGKLPPNTNPIILNGVSYISQADASRKLNVSMGTVSNWIRGRFKPRP
jgi:group I intron endonuclease